MTDPQEAAKQQLHKLLREYNSNVGMAKMVCSRPVELMPKSEQERLLKGFCTKENLKILAASREKLELAKSLQLDESESEKLEKAVPTLDKLLEAFSRYLDSGLPVTELREKVRAILDNPIPDSQDGLIDALPHIVDTLNFLSEQPVASKDDWDKMVDCVQLHEALTRTKGVCEALHSSIQVDGGQIAARSTSIDQTMEIAADGVEYLEAFFKEGKDAEELQAKFSEISSAIKSIWAS